MKEKRYIWSFNWTNGGFQVHVRRRRLHPTKGWRSERDEIRTFEEYPDAMAFIKEVESE